MAEHDEGAVARLGGVARTLAEIERLVHVGSWEWDLPADRVTWSDELYRILGLDRGDAPATYETYIERVHPDDRTSVGGALRAIGAGASIALEHRVVRPDGEIRFLQLRGEALRNRQGAIVRLFGTEQDITERREREAALGESERRFRTLVASAPDALVGADRDGRIVIVNEQTTALFGYTREELLAATVEDLLPADLRVAHAGHRAAYAVNARTRAMGSGLELAALRKDGTEFPVDVSLATIDTDDGPVVTAFVRDITERKRAEEATLQIQETAIRRKQALEINDSVVQGIAAAVLALEAGDALTAVRSLRATLDAARRRMGDLLAEQTVGDRLAAGDLVRAHPAAVLPAGVIEPRPSAPATVPDPIRVLIADDTEDFRMLLRYALVGSRGFEVVGEAGNGAEAVLGAKELRPDVVLLDLAMPVMDGLQALPAIRAVSPASKIVVLSGYDREQLAPAVRALEPDGYVEKGASTGSLISMLRELFPDRTTGSATVEPRTIEEQLAAGADVELHLSTYAHELSTPLTIVQGVGLTLLERMDQLPSPVVRELLESLTRNTRQMAATLEMFSDARLVGQRDLPLVLGQVDLATLVRETVSDLAEVTSGHPITVRTPGPVPVCGDPVRLRQALSNLLSNAARFSANGASIEVTVRSDEETASIAVTDHGPGIPAAARGRLFRRFERLGARGKGLGLGLYVSRGIARAHGGALSLARSDASGSTFVLTLPTVAPARSSPEGNAARDRS